MSAYVGQVVTSWSCVPLPTMRPPSRTMICCACLILATRCATMMTAVCASFTLWPTWRRQSAVLIGLPFFEILLARQSARVIVEFGHLHI